MASKKQQTVTVGGHKLRLSNMDKVLFPASGTTKGEVIHYFQTVADAMIPHARNRPATRKRWPDGVGTAEKPEQPFFRKNLEDSAPKWVPRQELEHSDHTNTYPLANNTAVLAWFGQVGALEIHVPQWRFSTTGDPQSPDRLVLDLDPGPGAGLAECAQVAHWCREILDEMNLPSIPVTSGSKGIHLYAALNGTYTSEQVSQVAKELARALEADHPDHVVSDMKKSLRQGKVLIDWSQNNRNKTTIAPYSLRGRPGSAEGPHVAAPRDWEELEGPDFDHLDMHQVMQRLTEGHDPLADFTSDDDAPEGLPEAQDPLTTYRSMRDAAKTPEPVPAGSPAARNDAPIFVVQEHHATALHYDTRLERDGVLVSWAVPKGPPLSTSEQHLAVMTEDHPIEYAEFEGTIPKGEYGGGEVTIWDTGTVEIEKWEERKVRFILHGQPDGGLGGVPRRYALVNTSKGDDHGKNWLIRLTKDQPKDEKPSEASPTPAKKSSKSPSKSRKPANDSEFPDPLPSPMLASPGKPSDIRGQGWMLEGKWDGYRAIAAVHPDGRVEIRSRNGKDFTQTFPELTEIAELVPAGTVVDGEVVALNSGSRPDFGLLQRRGKLTKTREIEQTAKKIPVHLMVFDVLHTAEHGDLTAEPYTQRRAILEELARSGKHVQVPGDMGDSLQEAMDVSLELKLEGLVAKRTDSPYRPGTRSREWVKIKHENHADVVIIGWRQGRGGRAKTFGSLLLGMTDDDGELHYAGRVGTGFSDVDLTDIRAQLEKLTRKTAPVDDVPREDTSDATWVTPKLTAEVRHSGVTRDNRLRHPTWRGIRMNNGP
ncbi:ATP-dependent DNA ligase [Nesterenkonia lutea]|uniref:DNA ligase (ATP) n=1 Tax=Nesterenkonia lutea TaxID=272919 RepID=A0ABR9JEL3_9MICC|nr:ATP-dependent DNA ligase [Nesterenkonia lutea]MBE1524369.1 bifunctional non-homologous end joining protein LigD [Nesterenkonia lutea]